MRAVKCGLLVRTEFILWTSGRLARCALFELQPVHGGILKICEVYSPNFRFLVFDRFFGVRAPFVGRSYPEPKGKYMFFKLVVRERPARCGKEAVNCGLINI